ncbi:MAG: FGGY-family carbohydrate kinase [Chloroflexi bacterium]|nr:FGGY-family carbohydrate kinase [Chloroflexota bacterium]
MRARHVLVVDAGTSAIRCHVYDAKAGIVASANSPWVFAQEPDAPELARSFDAGAVWRGVSIAIARCAAGREIAAVSVTSQRQALAFLDSKGDEIYIGPNLYLRAVFEGAALDEESGPRIYTQTGHIPTFMLAAGKLRWFQLHQPEAYARIATVLTLADWLTWKLSGELTRERTLAAESGLLNIWSRNSLADLYQHLGLHYDTVRLVDAGEVIGVTGTEGAAQAGLDSGIPVVTAGADTQAGLVGLGVVRASDVGLIAGWSAPVQMVTSQPTLAPKGETWTGLHIAPDRWVLESTTGDMGNAYRWLKDILLGAGDDGYRKLDALAESVPVGSEGARAYLGPGRMDMSKLGMRQGGMLFPVPMTITDFGREQLVRSTLEGFAFAVRANLEQIERLTDERAKQLSVGGGMALSKTFLRILTDVIGRPIRVNSDPKATARGAALAARIALGDYNDFDEAAESVQSQLDTMQPDPLDAAEYDDLYEEWTATGETLSDLMV